MSEMTLGRHMSRAYSFMWVFLGKTKHMLYFSRHIEEKTAKKWILGMKCNMSRNCLPDFLLDRLTMCLQNVFACCILWYESRNRQLHSCHKHLFPECFLFLFIFIFPFQCFELVEFCTALSSYHFYLKRNSKKHVYVYIIDF